MENVIKASTCRVDADGKQIGSAFWVSDNHLLTAAHVATAQSENNLTVCTNTGEEREVEVIYSDSNTAENPGSDIAVLSAQNKPNDCKILPVSPNIPKIGQKVLWSGYARLFGEKDSIDRQRFGWGRVASEKYENGGGLFFEIDGNFNPSHSGGPVVHEASGEVVGIVSESAGDFTSVLEKVQNRIEPLTRIRDFLIQRRSISGTFNQGFTYRDQEQATEDKNLLEELGFDINSKIDKNGRYVNYLDKGELAIRTSQLQADLSEILFRSLHGTVQMGIGVASGGPELRKHIPVEFDG